MQHSQLLKRIILKLNSSSIALLTMYISQCCHNRVLSWVYTDPYCFTYWATQGNIAPAAGPIQRINSCNIALPGRTILEVQLLEIEKVCIMTQVRIHGEIQPEPLGNPSGSTLGISHLLRLYFTVYPSTHHNRDTRLLIRNIADTTAGKIINNIADLAILISIFSAIFLIIQKYLW